MQNPFVPAIFGLAVTGFSGAGLAVGLPQGQTGQEANQAPAAAEIPLAEGLVKRIDKAAGRVTLAHGPLPNGMPAMTMPFRLKEAAWIDEMTVGQRIRFAADETDGEMVVVRFEPGP